MAGHKHSDIIERMTTQEKSRVLAEARGWEIKVDNPLVFGGTWVNPVDGKHWLDVPDFYETSNAAHAWDLLNWASSRAFAHWDAFNNWFYGFDATPQPPDWVSMTLQEMQATFLDKLVWLIMKGEGE